ncbi:hypothetical protein EJ04DRAFT_473962 [Polyplosphaeria fusca]|uniref:Reverse transcriptase domain-containing protein n=1 Tax=Polyplosphaeria fusca TaxID=682080 RepID=A0A9P4QPX8_9PLEO|nr:hypothetical protein EJ04DRAFT_473962 [Polyplosphaeria fusca]
MAVQSSFLSQTLQSITTTKMREQNKRRQTFEAHKAEILEAIEGSQDERSRLDHLVRTFKKVSASNKGIWYIDDDRRSTVGNVTRFLEQSRSDPSVSLSILRGFEDSFLQKLDQESQRFRFADLYYRLLSEWTNPGSDPIAASETNEDLGGSYEHVQKYNLQKLKDKFSSVAFNPLETDEIEIDSYMSSLFEDDHAASKLEDVRNSMAAFGYELKERSAPFDKHVIVHCIRALLTNDLLNDDAKSTLAEFENNDLVLEEIADVLNLRFADLDNWTWEADEGMYYEPRRQGNGKYRIMMDQDILQAIFLHYIAVSWCVQLRSSFSDFPYDAKFWKGTVKKTSDQSKRCHFFLPTPTSSLSGVAEEQMKTFRETFNLSPLPTSIQDTSDLYREDKPNKGDNKTGKDIRQMLLHQIATDVLIRRSFHGNVVVVQSDLQWYASGLPHSTIFAILRFWGISEEWIAFFKKFAEAPLRMEETPGQNVRIRQRGIPITDAFEKLFGEIVLLSMDVAVNRLSKMTLVRFHDDLWLSGEPAQCAKAWQTILEFVKVFGLDINWTKTGSVYLAENGKDGDIASTLPPGPVCMGMLQLTPEGIWSIDQAQVSAHTRQLRKQLGKCKGVVMWIQTWNACIGKFFQNVFGSPANCFGQGHVDAILQTFAQIQGELFDDHSGSVTDYLREQIKNRFGVEDVPDSFFFLPEEFGGLGLKNPFIPFFLLKEDLMKDPHDRIEEFRAEERKAYKEHAEAFAALTHAQRKHRFKYAFDEDKTHASIIDEPFFSFEEYTMHREAYSRLLKSAYLDLMAKPTVQDVQLTHEMKPWFDELAHSHNTGWSGLASEDKWIMDLYAEELRKRFGALSIVDRNLLPSGIMKLMQRKRVTWQLIFWD